MGVRKRDRGVSPRGKRDEVERLGITVVEGLSGWQAGGTRSGTRKAPQGTRVRDHEQGDDARVEELVNGVTQLMVPAGAAEQEIFCFFAHAGFSFPCHPM